MPVAVVLASSTITVNVPELVAATAISAAVAPNVEACCTAVGVSSRRRGVKVVAVSSETRMTRLALAFVVRGLKEFGEPARKALIIGEAKPELRARTYGAYYLIRDCVVTTGSFLGAWLWSLGPRANFIGAAVCGGLGTIWFWWFVFRRDLPRVGKTS